VKLYGHEGIAMAVFAKACEQAFNPPKPHRTKWGTTKQQTEERDHAIAWLMGRTDSVFCPDTLADLCIDVTGLDLDAIRQRLAGVLGADAGTD
jgi:hypothetical protein